MQSVQSTMSEALKAAKTRCETAERRADTLEGLCRSLQSRAGKAAPAAADEQPPAVEPAAPADAGDAPAGDAPAVPTGQPPTVSEDDAALPPE